MMGLIELNSNDANDEIRRPGPRSEKSRLGDPKMFPKFGFNVFYWHFMMMISPKCYTSSRYESKTVNVMHIYML